MTIGERMKINYERANSYYLSRRIPVILRLDGKCFHTFTRGCQRPFDIDLGMSIINTAREMVEEIQGAKFAYTQSDEISILITDYDALETSAWFDYNIQKMCSVSASMCTAMFSSYYSGKKGAMFDARVFNVPKEEVVNYFIWRQKDWIRNSVQMVAQSEFSPKLLHGIDNSGMKLMLLEKGIDWNDFDPMWKYGNIAHKLIVSDSTKWVIEPAFQFTDNREFFDKYLVNGE
jgi:tRNA(His) 5'-end guanylyltransferase